MASKRNLRQRACRGKIRHASMEAAWTALRWMGKVGTHHAYRCPHCHGYHIGHREAPRITRRNFKAFW